MTEPRRAGGLLLLLAFAALACTGFGAVGCQAGPRNLAAIDAYYRYEFGHAREALRPAAETVNDEKVLLNNIRLGLAALADGDVRESERALGRSFDLLSTAGLNADRTTAAVLVHEGVKIWKGEPFEQALSYHWVATLYAIMGDWENARAASANALFRLTDFGADQDAEKLATQAAKDDDYLEEGYTAVDTDFALGFLMQALASDITGAPGSARLYDAAVAIDERLAGIVETLRMGDADTLLLVDYGKGPTKIAYGPDDALAKFAPQENSHGRAVVTVDGRERGRYDRACDVEAMALDHRWNNLEDVRKAKSAIGRALEVSGAIVATHAAANDDSGSQMLGLGLMLAGAITRAGARADTRYMEYAPSSIFLIPLHLSTESDVEVFIEGAEGSRYTLPALEPGDTKAPRAVYVRLHGPDSPAPHWLAAAEPYHGNANDGVGDGELPWILGGTDVSPPNRRTLEQYHADGVLTDLTVRDLADLYRAEGILVGSGMSDGTEIPRNLSFKHILEGGAALYTPARYSMGWKRLMFTPHGPYVPKTEPARNLAARLRVEFSDQPDPGKEPVR